MLASILHTIGFDPVVSAGKSEEYPIMTIGIAPA
jgi:hypothetical protein